MKTTIQDFFIRTRLASPCGGARHDVVEHPLHGRGPSDAGPSDPVAEFLALSRADRRELYSIYPSIYAPVAAAGHDFQALLGEVAS